MPYGVNWFLENLENKSPWIAFSLQLWYIFMLGASLGFWGFFMFFSLHLWKKAFFHLEAALAAFCFQPKVFLQFNVFLCSVQVWCGVLSHCCNHFIFGIWCFSLWFNVFFQFNVFISTVQTKGCLRSQTTHRIKWLTHETTEVKITTVHQVFHSSHINDSNGATEWDIFQGVGYWTRWSFYKLVCILSN